MLLMMKYTLQVQEAGHSLCTCCCSYTIIFLLVSHKVPTTLQLYILVYNVN
jgi:hypothetical protein